MSHIAGTGSMPSSVTRLTHLRKEEVREYINHNINIVIINVWLYWSTYNFKFYRTAVVHRHRRYHNVPRCHWCYLLDCPRRYKDGSGWFTKHGFCSWNTFIYPRADRDFTYVTIVKSFYYVGFYGLIFIIIHKIKTHHYYMEH